MIKIWQLYFEQKKRRAICSAAVREHEWAAADNTLDTMIFQLTKCFKRFFPHHFNYKLNEYIHLLSDHIGFFSVQ